MRWSVRPSDPGSANFAGFGAHPVFVDGREVKCIITADEQAGTVEYAVVDENERCIPIRTPRGAEIKTAILRGRVEIRAV